MMKLVSLFAALATGVSAGQYQVPDGCEAVLTLQSVDCSISHYYRCEGDNEGDTHRVDIGEDGITFYTRTDSEARWIESIQFTDGHHETLGKERDSASMTELLSQDVDSWDFDMVSKSGLVERFIGFDRLTGASVEIDGQRLLRTEFDMRATQADGATVNWSSKGSEYVHPELRIFIGGRSTVFSDGEEYSRDGSPVQFDLPGESGFLSTEPLYGCSVNLARATIGGLPLNNAAPRG